MGWRGFGFVHRSRTLFCRAVPNLSITIRNFFIAVRPRTCVIIGRALPPTLRLLAVDGGPGALVVRALVRRGWVAPGRFSAAQRSRVSGRRGLIGNGGLRLTRPGSGVCRSREGATAASWRSWTASPRRRRRRRWTGGSSTATSCAPAGASACLRYYQRCYTYALLRDYADTNGY
jgi:hypothetical protein